MQDGSRYRVQYMNVRQKNNTDPNKKEGGDNSWPKKKEKEKE